jgi:hypothetical protein
MELNLCHIQFAKINAMSVLFHKNSLKGYWGQKDNMS